MSNLVKVIDKHEVAIEVPFELKGLFKKHFPSAKWDKSDKVWVVDIENYDNLVAFAETIEPEVEKIKAKENADLQEKELEAIRNEAAKVADNITKGKDTVAKLKEVNELIESESAELEEAKAELEAVENEKEAELESVKEFVNGIVDVSKIEGAVEDMKRNHRAVKSKNKDAFHDAQNSVEKEAEKLEKVGFESKYLKEVVGANFNRADRDNLNDLNEDDLYVLEKVEDED